MCIMWNKPTPPSGFPRSIMFYVQEANDLGNPLGGVSSFHMIHIVFGFRKFLVKLQEHEN